MKIADRKPELDGRVSVLGVSLNGEPHPLRSALEKVSNLTTDLNSVILIGCHPSRPKDLAAILPSVSPVLFDSDKFFPVSQGLLNLADHLAHLMAEELIFILAPAAAALTIAAESKGLALKDRLSSDPHWQIKTLPLNQKIVCLFYSESHLDLEVFCAPEVEAQVRRSFQVGGQ